MARSARRIAVGIGRSDGAPGTGIGHTRWATHGASPRRTRTRTTAPTAAIHIAVNGIVENYVALQESLLDNGSVFTSETDAEVIAHLIAKHYDGDLADGGPRRLPASCTATTRSSR